MWLGPSILIIKDMHLLLHSWTNILSYRVSTTWKQRKLRTLDSQAGCCTSFHNSSFPARCWPSWCYSSTYITYINHNLKERQQRNFLVFELNVRCMSLHKENLSERFLGRVALVTWAVGLPQVLVLQWARALQPIVQLGFPLFQSFGRTLRGFDAWGSSYVHRSCPAGDSSSLRS